MATPKFHGRFWSRVNKTANCWNWTGATTGGYGRIWRTEDGVAKRELAHRVSFEMTNGAIPTDKVIDHICHNTLCVRPSHLQAVTQKQNTENLQGVGTRNTSGVTGVWWNKRNQKWDARVMNNGHRHNVGSFNTLEEAERAVVEKRNELFTNNLRDRRPILRVS